MSAELLRSGRRLLRSCALLTLVRGTTSAVVPSAYAAEARQALEIVRSASVAAAALQRRQIASLSKADTDGTGFGASPVTVADFTVQALILGGLSAVYPADRFIAEETSAQLREGGADVVRAVVDAVGEFGVAGPCDAASVCASLDLGSTGAAGGWSATGRTWVLDPIDGTKGFVRGEQFAIALSLLDGGAPVVAVLGCPNLAGPGGQGGALFWAERGHGAYCRGVRGESDGDEPGSVDCVDEPLRVDAAAGAADVVRCESAEAAHSSFGRSAAAASALGFVRPPIRIDGQGKYGLLARGEAHVYTRLPRPGYVENIWDVAAGALIVQEAGGRVTDTLGRELDFSLGSSLAADVRGVVATAGPLHGAVLAALADAADE